MELFRFLPLLFLSGAFGFSPFTHGKSKVVFVIAEREYQTEKTLPKFAASYLSKEFKAEFSTAPKEGLDRHQLKNAAAISQADLLIISVRRRAFSDQIMQSIRSHIAHGKPVLGLRTASHAFELRNDSPLEGHRDWPAWDQEVIGGNYQGHYGKNKSCLIRKIPAAMQPSLLKQVKLPFRTPASLYRNSPLPMNSVPILEGVLSGFPTEPVAWTHVTKSGAKVFYTSLGHVKDFENPSFNQLLQNAIRWCLKKP
jgi:type 1 glutamine amidotransferase